MVCLTGNHENRYFDGGRTDMPPISSAPVLNILEFRFPKTRDRKISTLVVIELWLVISKVL